MRASTVRLAGIAFALVGVLLASSGCSSDTDGQVPQESATAAPSDSGEQWTRAEIEASVFDGEIGTSTELGSVSGSVPDRVDDLQATITVTEVLAGASSTLVRFTLASTGSDIDIELDAFNSLAPLTKDIRDIAIVDTAGGQRLQPFVGVSVALDDVSMCSCAGAPTGASASGQILSGIFPPLTDDATTIDVEIPGFPTIEAVAVTRR